MGWPEIKLSFPDEQDSDGHFKANLLASLFTLFVYPF